MPAIILSQVSKEGGNPTQVGSVSYKTDDTFHDLRRKLEVSGLLNFPFQFIDSLTGTRMLVPLEKLNCMQDYGSSIQVIPLLESPIHLHDWETPSNFPEPLLGSANGSNSIPDSDSVQASQLEESSAFEEVVLPNQVRREANSADEVGSQIQLLSVLMSSDLKREWERHAKRLSDFMSCEAFKSHRWKVVTGDKAGIAFGKILCVECNDDFHGISKGIMDKHSISNCFVNYRPKHLGTQKHARAVLQNSNRPASNEDVSAAMSGRNGPSDRDILAKHIRNVNDVNSSQPGREPTFQVQGDLNREPLHLNYFKVRCHYCTELISLVPKQRNLQHNLTQHCASAKHIEYYEKCTSPASGAAIITGRAGRPRTTDKRDVRQRTIGIFFGSIQSDSGQSSQSSIANTLAEKGDGSIFDPNSFLCWGLWRSISSGPRQARPIKEILSDFRPGNCWHPEIHTVNKVFNKSSGTWSEIQGTFRHSHCSRISVLGGGFKDLTCEKCWSIQHQIDFRLRVYRESKAIRKRGSRTTAFGLRLGYMTVDEILSQARLHSGTIQRERKHTRVLQHRVVMLQARVPNLRELCTESLSSGSILKFCNSIVLAHRKGAFGGREALWDLLRDIAGNLNRTQQGQRYRKGTKLICQALFQHGGRRVVDCLASNMIGPSLNTLQKDRRGMPLFRSGLNVEQFQFISDVYKKLKERLGIQGPLPCYVAEDETCVKRMVRWLPQRDTLLGFCGKKDHHHVCIPGLEFKVGEGEEGFKNITQAFEENVIGHQARVMIVNPLHSGFPRLCLMASSTCNRFDFAWVQGQWNNISELWNSHCLESVGPLLGHASDGDGRRRKLMVEDYTGRGVRERRENLGWPGWSLTHSLVKVGDKNIAHRLHDQDYIHNAKKLVNPLDSTAKTLKMGSEMANISHVIQVFNAYSVEEHGLTLEDIKRTDRQNWASAQRLCSRKVVTCLAKLRTRTDGFNELCAGTEAYLTICADYVDIFLNKTLSLRERIILCGKVSFFFRLWRQWIFHGNHGVGGNRQPITINSMISMQSFLDIQISMHFVVLLIIQFRDNFSELEVPLHLTGSDSCEQFFSKVGGMAGHERSYDLSELVDCATSLNRLVMMDLTDGIHGIGKSHKKHRNIWMKIHYGQNSYESANLTDYRGIKTNVEVIDCLKEGLDRARELATIVQMNPSTSAKQVSWWTTPWIVEARGFKFGGWCDVIVEKLPLSLDNMEEDDPAPELSSPTEEEEGVIYDGVCDATMAMSEMHGTMSEMHAELNSDSFVLAAPKMKPTVSFEGRVLYKSTLVSQLVLSPLLSKDRLTRVKQSIYFNNLVDKPASKDGASTMFMSIGDSCGVFFVAEPQPGKATRSKGLLKAFGGKSTTEKSPTTIKKSGRGEAVSVVAPPLVETYVWWIGKVPSIRKKYGKQWGRTREPVDLLDRPGKNDESSTAVCEVLFNWYTPIGRLKFKYDWCDPQWINSESVISTVSITVMSGNHKVFVLNENDAQLLHDFVKNKI